MTSRSEQLSCFKSYDRLKLNQYKRRLRLNENMAHNDYTTCRWRYHCWLRHRQRVEEAEPFVDSKPPKFPPFVFARTCNFDRKLAAFARTEKENAILTYHIQNIMLGKGGIDNKLGPNAKSKFLNRGFRRIKDQVQIARQNQVFAERLLQIGAVYSRDEQMKWYREQENIMEFGSKYPLYWRERNCNEFEATAELKAQSGDNLQVYFDFEVKDREVGRVVMELYPSVAPAAIENFRVLCTTTTSRGFRCFQIDRMWQGLLWSIGRGARGIPTGFPPKLKKIKHDCPGVVTLANNGSDMFDAEFVITARELKPLDDRNLAIGYVTEGLDFLESLVKYKRNHSQRFRVPIYITGTGEIDPNGPPPPPLPKLNASEGQTGNDQGEEWEDPERVGSGAFEIGD